MPKPIIFSSLVYNSILQIKLASSLIQGFLRVAPNSSTESFSFEEHLHMLSCSGYPVHQSLLLGGVVIPVSKEELFVDVVRRGNDGMIKVALFETSLAGDLEGKEN